MSKIETGKMELNPIDYDMPSLISDTVQMSVMRIGSKPLEFVLDIDEKLPSRMIGDELRLKQILNNLLSNAVKYTEEGFVKLSVSHSTNDGELMLSFRIEDSGQGMKPEDMERLFAEYSRFNAESNQYVEGTGLGLNITRNLVKMMGGTITAESEYGKGSVFTATVRQGAVECEVIGRELSARLREFKFTGRKIASSMQIVRTPMPYGRVLIVDDVATNLYVAQGLLMPYQLNVETVESGFEAVDRVKAGNVYDIIFMDHMMPEMDGIETTHRIRELGYDGIIVALTANAIVGNDKMFKANGLDDFVSKPIDVKQFNAVLNKYIRDRRSADTMLDPTLAADSAPANAMLDPLPEMSHQNPKLLEIFCRDAEKAIVTMRETVREKGMKGIKLFTTTAHAMKSALANVGEKELSNRAFELEKTGSRGEMCSQEEVDGFIESLESLVETLAPECKICDDSDICEDTDYLKTQLYIIKAACEDYDDDTAIRAIDSLKTMSWKHCTSATLEQIRDELFLHSDFETAANNVEKLIKEK
jgi:CheY-like chemotaxis protein/anti-sigma regulatory factor (Ser/Thr protein kinase)